MGLSSLYGPLGLVAAVATIVGLAWQIWSHHRHSRRISIQVSYAIPIYGEPDKPVFLNDDQVSIDVTNRGDNAATVVSFGVAIGKRGALGNLTVTRPHAMCSKLPAKLLPGESPVQLAVPVEDLRRFHAESGVPYREMRPWVRLGDGRKISAKRTIPLR